MQILVFLLLQVPLPLHASDAVCPLSPAYMLPKSYLPEQYNILQDWQGDSCVPVKSGMSALELFC